MAWVVSNNGTSIRWVDASENYQVRDGERLFSGDDRPTDVQLAAAFPSRERELQRRDTIAQIAALESQQTARRVREAALGIDGGWLQKLESQISALRAALQ